MRIPAALTCLALLSLHTGISSAQVLSAEDYIESSAFRVGSGIAPGLTTKLMTPRAIRNLRAQARAVPGSPSDLWFRRLDELLGAEETDRFLRETWVEPSMKRSREVLNAGGGWLDGKKKKPPKRLGPKSVAKEFQGRGITRLGMKFMPSMVRKVTRRKALAKYHEAAGHAPEGAPIRVWFERLKALLGNQEFDRMLLETRVDPFYERMTQEYKKRLAAEPPRSPTPPTDPSAK